MSYFHQYYSIPLLNWYNTHLTPSYLWQGGIVFTSVHFLVGSQQDFTKTIGEISIKLV